MRPTRFFGGDDAEPHRSTQEDRQPLPRRSALGMADCSRSRLQKSRGSWRHCFHRPTAGYQGLRPGHVRAARVLDVPGHI